MFPLKEWYIYEKQKQEQEKIPLISILYMLLSEFQIQNALIKNSVTSAWKNAVKHKYSLCLYWKYIVKIPSRYYMLILER